MKKLALLVLTTIIIAISQNPLSVNAKENVMEFSDSQEISNDTAALDGYIAIRTRSDLEQIGTTSSSTEKYYLANDIDLSGQDWVPLNYYHTELIIDGQGHAIKNMSVDSPDSWAGLLYSTPGKLTITNLTFENVNLNGQYAGAIMGFMSPGGWVEQRYTFSNISVSGSISTSSKAGGLVGYAGHTYDENGYINFIECTNDAGITSSAPFGGDYVGGIVGEIDDGKDEVSFKSCINNGDIEGNYAAAGICGHLRGVNISFSECDNKGNITSSSVSGGIVAEAQGEGTNNCNIVKCNNSGKIRSKRYMGGIVGCSDDINMSIADCTNSGDIDCLENDYPYTYAGGIVGICHDNYLNISNCKNTASIKSGGYDVGGILGYSSDATSLNINLCTNEGNLSLGVNRGGIVGSISGSYSSENPDESKPVNYAITNCENKGSAKAGILASAFLIHENNLELTDIVSIEDCVNNGTIDGDAGIASDIRGYVECTIRNCTNNKDVITENESAAGIYNKSNNNTYSGTVKIIDCVNEGNIGAINGDAAGISVGGTEIRNCANKGIATADSNDGRYCVAAGISVCTCEDGSCSLSNHSDSNGNIYDCVNYGKVSSSGYAAGIAGYVQNVERSLNFGEVHAEEYAAGIAYRLESLVSQSINYGKIFSSTGSSGIAYYGNVSDCINVGNVRSIQVPYGEELICHDVHASGIAGVYGEITNSYNLGQVITGPGYSHKLLSAGIGSSDNKINGCINLSSRLEAQWKEELFANEDNYANAQAIGFKVDLFNSGNNFYRSDGVLDEKVSIATGKDKDVFYSRDIYDEAGWDFENVWEMPPKGGLPVLKWQNLDEGLYLKEITTEDDEYEFDFDEPDSDDDTELKIKGFVNSALEYTETSTEDGLQVCRIDTTESQLFVSPKVTTGATYKMYKNIECTDEYRTDLFNLELGNNFIYVKIEKDVAGQHKEAVCVIYIIRSKKVETAITSDMDVVVPFERSEVRFKWGPALFDQGPDTRNDKLAVVGLALSAAAENSQARVEEVAGKLGFTQLKPEWFNVAKNKDNPAYLIGSEEILIKGQKKILVALVVRGTTNGSEDIQTDIKAQVDGFQTPSNNTYNKLVAYVNEHFPDKKDDIVFFVTGHSLGGACAVLTGQLITRDFPRAKTYVYSFATPKYTAFSYGAHKYIHQYINVHDAVPCLPIGVFNRVGNLYEFRGNDTEFQYYWDGLTGGNKAMPPWYIITFGGHLGQFLIDNNEYSNHSNNIYMAYLLHNVHGAYTVVDNKSSGKRFVITVECPVDVTIKNAEGKVLVSIIDNKVDENSIADGFNAYVDGDKKYIQYSSEDDIKVELTGTDDGTMRYSVFDLSYDDRPSTNVVFENVKLSKGKEFAFEINKDDKIEESKLFVVDPKTKEPLGEVASDGGETDLRIHYPAIYFGYDELTLGYTKSGNKTIYDSVLVVPELADYKNIKSKIIWTMEDENGSSRGAKKLISLSNGRIKVKKGSEGHTVTVKATIKGSAGAKAPVNVGAGNGSDGSKAPESTEESAKIVIKLVGERAASDTYATSISSNTASFDINIKGKNVSAVTPNPNVGILLPVRAISAAKNSKIKWSVLPEDKRIASVSSKGLVKGKSEGTAHIMAEIDGKSVIYTVNVHVASISFKQPKGYELNEGGSINLANEVEAITGIDTDVKDVIWSIPASQTKYGTVSEDGMVTKTGSKGFTVYAELNGVRCKVRVK